jgi:hypothetical protein
LARTDQQINAIKSQIEALKSPEAIAASGGTQAAQELTQQLQANAEKLKQFKAEAESTLASLRVDPVLAFTQALRQLNLAFAESQERNQQQFEGRKTRIAQSQLAGFKTNKQAGRQAALDTAVAEREKAKADLADLQSAVNEGSAAIASPEFQSTLQRLSVSPDSSVAKIDDVLKNTSDEADRGILEKLKSERERRNQLAGAKTVFSESQLKVQQATQDISLTQLQDSANKQQQILQRTEAKKLKDDNTSLGMKGAIASQLNSLGFGTNELQILEKRSQIESEIADKKLEALKLEQAYQRQSLQLDLKRQKISAQMAVFEAESARLAAAKAKLEAESALRIATIKKDKVGIEAAKVEIELASRGAELADKKFSAAEDNLKVQDELARNATLAQEATQKAALNQELAADSARRQAAALERVEASAPKIQKQESRDTTTAAPASSPTANNDVPGWENPYIQKPGEGLFDYESRINWMKMTGQIVETNNPHSAPWGVT